MFTYSTVKKIVTLLTGDHGKKSVTERYANRTMNFFYRHGTFYGKIIDAGPCSKMDFLKIVRGAAEFLGISDEDTLEFAQCQYEDVVGEPGELILPEKIGKPGPFKKDVQRPPLEAMKRPREEEDDDGARMKRPREEDDEGAATREEDDGGATKKKRRRRGRCYWPGERNFRKYNEKK